MNYDVRMQRVWRNNEQQAILAPQAKQAIGVPTRHCLVKTILPGAKKQQRLIAQDRVSNKVETLCCISPEKKLVNGFRDVCLLLLAVPPSSASFIGDWALLSKAASCFRLSSGALLKLPKRHVQMILFISFQMLVFVPVCVRVRVCVCVKGGGQWGGKSKMSMHAAVLHMRESAHTCVHACSSDAAT